jgi:hypothetical protein
VVVVVVVATAPDTLIRHLAAARAVSPTTFGVCKTDRMTDNETITVALLYAALALVGPFVLTRLARWAESQEAANLAMEIGMAIEGYSQR